MNDKNYQMGFRSGYRRTAAAWSKQNTESEDVKKFENMLYDKILELKTELEDSNTDREKEVLENQIDTLKCVLGHLFNLKSGGDETRIIEITEANSNFRQTNHERK